MIAFIRRVVRETEWFRGGDAWRMRPSGYRAGVTYMSERILCPIHGPPLVMPLRVMVLKTFVVGTWVLQRVGATRSYDGKDAEFMEFASGPLRVRLSEVDKEAAQLTSERKLEAIRAVMES